MPQTNTPTQPVQWYEIKALARAAAADGEAAKSHADIYIYGNIGDRWNEDGVIASRLVQEIAALEVDTIALRINSYGGSVTDGMAIYNALKRHKATVSSYVDGVAISCASYIAMAGETITMAANAQMMIHAPWGYAMGNAQQLREQAEVLDRYAKAMAHAYADKSGKSYEDALALITDGKDHWYLADEAVAEGFADEVGGELAIAASLARSFDLARFTTPAAATRQPVGRAVSPTAAPAAQPQEHSMPEATTQAAPTAAPFARTKDDNAKVLAMFKPFANRPEISALQTDVLADPALTIDTIQARLLAELGKGVEPANPQNAAPRVEKTQDEADKRIAAAADALLVRAGVQVDPKVRANLQGNPYRGAKLLDLARASLERAGTRSEGMLPMEIVAAAFTQGTSDFPVLLENTMHKALQARYATAALTWNRFCATGTVSDFRAHNRYRLGSFGNLDDVNELGEFVNKSIPDGEKGSITATTKGNIINLSRTAIINDDLGAFVGLAGMLGQAAARTVEAAVYALLAQNSGNGPLMPDGKALFHADHGNLTTGAAISMAALDLDRVAMASQKDVSGNDYLDLRPAVLLVPIGLGGTARSINDAQYDPDTANKLQKPNIVNGLFRDIVDTPRLTGTRRYLFAEPSEAPVIEVAFLDGAQDPYLELQNGFDVDGARYKVRLDYGVAAIDYRGAVSNAGA